MISESKPPKEVKSIFLEKNPKYKEIDDTNLALGDFHTISDDDEIWLMQCPKGADISLLTGQKIKLPGRSNHEQFETVATEYIEPISHAFGHKSKKAHNAIKIVPIRGSILMRNRLKAMPPPDATEVLVSPVKVPMPTGIKERHPLHGVDFASRLEICPQIAERLKEADRLAPPMEKPHKKQSKTKTIALDSDGEVELVLQKKPKHKKKRKHSDGSDASNEVSKKKNKKSKKNGHVDMEEEVAEGMQWIQRL